MTDGNDVKIGSSPFIKNLNPDKIYCGFEINGSKLWMENRLKV